MNSEQVDRIVTDMQQKMQEKQSTYIGAEAGYNKCVAKYELTLNIFQDLKSKRYNLENQLKAAEYNLKEYENIEKELEKQIRVGKGHVDELKEPLDKITTDSEKNDTLFHQEVLKIANTMDEYRTIYDPQTSNQTIKILKEKINSVKQEISDVTDTFQSLKDQFPLAPNKSSQSFLDVIETVSLELKAELDELKLKNLEHSTTTKILEAKKSIKEKELEGLC